MTNDIAYLQPLSRHKVSQPIDMSQPVIKNAWIAPNASLVGCVHVSEWATVWYNAVLRAEHNAIRIGHFSSIGDGSTLYTSNSLPAGVPSSINVGKNVTIGSNVSLHSCIIDDDVKVGDKVVISAGCVLERGCEIAPNSIVPPGRLIPAG